MILPAGVKLYVGNQVYRGEIPDDKIPEGYKIKFSKVGKPVKSKDKAAE
jgi:hypothetical protein